MLDQNLINTFDSYGKQEEIKTMRLLEKISSGQGLIINNLRLNKMSVTEFVILICFIDDNNMGKLMIHRTENNQFNQIFVEKMNDAANWENDLSDIAIERICFWEDGIRKIYQDAWQKEPAETPQVIIDLINAGQLEQETINGKYKPVNKITIFMEWLYNNGYEDYLNFSFFKKFIFFENKDGTIIQYLKPSNFGIKRQKRNKKTKK